MFSLNTLVKGSPEQGILLPAFTGNSSSFSCHPALCHLEHLGLQVCVLRGERGQKVVLFLFPGSPETCRHALTHTSLKSHHLLGAETVAAVPLLPAFQLNSEPSGNPGCHSQGFLYVAATFILICAISGSGCLRGET